MAYFSSFLPTVRVLFEDFDTELSKFLVEANIDEEWVEHDNWNGGIDFYNIIVDIPVEVFQSLRKRNVLETSETELIRCYAYSMRGEGESLQIRNVIFRPSRSEVSQVGDNLSDKMWKNGYFRLFISHISENKDSACNLKDCLQSFGIDGFVAHVDITPSKEWEKEIESALFSLDALCAIVVPKFEESKWCDQEIGIALGRSKAVFSIKKGNDPYGFLGKYQALPNKSNAHDMAKDIMSTICANEITRGEYFTKLVNLILNSSSEPNALKFIQILSDSKFLDKQYVSLLHDNLVNNQTLMNDNLLDAVNPLFLKYGLDALVVKQEQNNANNDMELPF